MIDLINIALVIDALDRGGAERILVSIANNLDYKKYKVYVITTHHLGNLASDLESIVEVHCLNRQHQLDFLSLFTFINFIKKNKIQIVHTHCHSSAYFVEIAKCISHNYFVHIMHDHYGPILESPWVRRYDKFFLRNLDFYFGVSRQLVEYAILFLGLPKNRCMYIPNGIEIPSSIGFTRKEGFTVVQVGSITPNKNHQLAIKIASKVSTFIPNLRWLIIGSLSKDKNHLEFIQKEIQAYHLEHIFFLLGEKNDVSEYLKQAQVGVLTSINEGLPIALLEYMAYKLPVVVTDVGECKQVVEKCKGGKAYSLLDEDIFSKTLIELAHNPLLAINWGKENYSNVKLHYSVNSMVSRICKVYDKIIKEDME